jgi:membrane protein required for colicin V production
VLAFIFAPPCGRWSRRSRCWNKFLGESCELATIAAFAAVFALALVLFSIITPLFSSVVQRSALGGVDQGMGFLFGVARGILLVAMAFIVYDRVMARPSRWRWSTIRARPRCSSACAASWIRDPAGRAGLDHQPL